MCGWFQAATTMRPTCMRLAGYEVLRCVRRCRVSDTVELFGRVENLFDEDYQTAAGYGTPGRGAYIGARARFLRQACGRPRRAGRRMHALPVAPTGAHAERSDHRQLSTRAPTRSSPKWPTRRRLLGGLALQPRPARDLDGRWPSAAVPRDRRHGRGSARARSRRGGGGDVPAARDRAGVRAARHPRRDLRASPRPRPRTRRKSHGWPALAGHPERGEALQSRGSKRRCAATRWTGRVSTAAVAGRRHRPGRTTLIARLLDAHRLRQPSGAGSGRGRTCRSSRCSPTRRSSCWRRASERMLAHPALRISEGTRVRDARSLAAVLRRAERSCARSSGWPILRQGNRRDDPADLLLAARCCSLAVPLSLLAGRVWLGPGDHPQRRDHPRRAARCRARCSRWSSAAGLGGRGGDAGLLAQSAGRPRAVRGGPRRGARRGGKPVVRASRASAWLLPLFALAGRGGRDGAARR